jgi:hypothetical protein
MLLSLWPGTRGGTMGWHKGRHKGWYNGVAQGAAQGVVQGVVHHEVQNRRGYIVPAAHPLATNGTTSEWRVPGIYIVCTGTFTSWAQEHPGSPLYPSG